jgi:hypothetical protein
MKYLGILAVLAVAAGCAGAPVPAAAVQPASLPARSSAPAESGAPSEQKVATADEALFQHACQQTLFDNPRKDYARALKAFEEYIRRFPKGAHLKEAKNWRSILKTILDLREENDRLNKKIVELTQIDILHEEKRDQ